MWSFRNNKNLILWICYVVCVLSNFFERNRIKYIEKLFLGFFVVF